MPFHLVPFARYVTALLLAVGIAACSSSPTDSGVIPDFEGSYSLSGYYSGRVGNAVDGTLTVTNQVGSAATVAISVKLTDAGNVFFALNAPDPDVQATSAPVQAELKSDGSFLVTYTGPEVISGLDPASCCMYNFTLSGKLSGSQITGTWQLTRDMPSSDSGTFTAAP